MKSRIYLFIACLFAFSFQMQAQTETHSALPSWVAMIDNPNANYYEAIKAFDTYWAGKEIPDGDADKAGASKEEKRERKEMERKLKRMSPAEHEQYNLIAYHYKRFMNWSREVKPFVQNDGRILSMQERIDIWNKQQEEITKTKK